MIPDLLALAGGLALLGYAADQFVIGAARLAVRLRLSSVVIGAVVIGFGTSAPELVVSTLAAAQDRVGIAVGNIVGSNTANLALVLGAAALMRPLTVKSSILRRETPLSVAAVLAFGLVVQGGLSVVEGIVLLVAMGAALTWIFAAGRATDDLVLAEEVDEFLEESSPHPLRVEVTRTLLGLVGTVAGAQILIGGASSLASRIGLTEGFIGLTLVAIGTSLPELATAIQAARKDETDLVVGNLLGSNIFNSLAVAGAAALAGPGQAVDPTLTGFAVALMLGVALVASLFMLTARQVTRLEGALLVAAYVVVVPFLA
ncbi:MAG: calcium/sodium antiporter [Nitriliruptorales bacterium]